MQNKDINKEGTGIKNIGIDNISLYMPKYYLDHADLAKARNIDPEKYHKGLGQKSMSVPTPDEDIVTMAANAASEFSKEDLSKVSWVLFATESGVDQSKAAGLYIHSLLDLPDDARVIELKQACYSGTAALQLAKDLLANNQDKKILILASDIARYGLNTTGESSQGAGAIALLISHNPKIIKFTNQSGVYTQDVMDFWRPNYTSNAIVDGKYSCDVYLSCLIKCYERYLNNNKSQNIKLSDFAAICFHVPVPKLAMHALTKLARFENLNLKNKNKFNNLWNSLDSSLKYSAIMGNSYTASLYVSLLSLLCHGKKDELLDKKYKNKIGLFSYGSGCVSEFFEGILNPEYDKYLNKNYLENMLNSREKIDIDKYEAYFSYKYPTDGSSCELPVLSNGRFRLAKIIDHKRIYTENTENKDNILYKSKTNTTDNLDVKLESVY